MHYQAALAMRPDYFLARYGLGRALLEKGELDTAIQHFRAALLIRPEHADCHTVLAVALDEKGETAEAIQHYEKALEISPKSIPALTNLGWLIATSSNGSLRNGARAVEIARRADELSGGSNPIVLRTLAAAYAEAGQFGQAIETAGAAIQLSRLSGDHSLSSALEEQLRLYRLGIPYREAAKLKEP
jgi:Flp pilus assembly protein TadD